MVHVRYECLNFKSSSRQRASLGLLLQFDSSCAWRTTPGKCRPMILVNCRHCLAETFCSSLLGMRRFKAYGSGRKDVEDSEPEFALLM